ncbi:MAG: YraN family protein [Eubacteriales bacterium]|nr:YraN family protein [Eubacteriales bacterium]
MGYRISQRNMRNKYSEIDIIAENKEYIIFVEVKTRTGEFDLRPSFAVDRIKQQKIISAAFGYIKSNKIKKQPRFDVAEVFLGLEDFEPYKINYIENAYSQGGAYAVF